MKKTKFLFIFLLALMTSFLISCNDDSVDVDENPDEGDNPGQQSGLQEELGLDLLLEYSLSFKASSTGYDGDTVTADLEAIADLFGITLEELYIGVDSGETSDGTVFKCYGINYTSQTDESSASSTNAPWGHWWDAEGEATTWADGDGALFGEFYTENGYWIIGQYPGGLSEGADFHCIEAIKYNSLKAGIHFTVSTPAAIDYSVATIAGSQDLTLEVEVRSDYTSDPVEFDLATALSNIGASSIDDITWVAIDTTSYTDQAETGTGFWYDSTGTYCTYSGGYPTLYTEYISNDTIGIGQNPGVAEAGKTYPISYGLYYEGKIEMLNIAVSVVADNELANATLANTQPLSISIDTSSIWAVDSLAFDLSTTLTDLGISSMDEISSVVTYDADGEFTNITATGNVFWYDLEGNKSAYGEDASIYVNYGEVSEDQISIGQYPGNTTTTVGNTYKVYYGFMANSKVEMLEVSVTLTSAE